MCVQLTKLHLVINSFVGIMVKLRNNYDNRNNTVDHLPNNRSYTVAIIFVLLGRLWTLWYLKPPLVWALPQSCLFPQTTYFYSKIGDVSIECTKSKLSNAIAYLNLSRVLVTSMELLMTQKQFIPVFLSIPLQY